ncbi:uncharacterized protein CANTADRAFT_266053 [Suhomyces tanzawaensis NRRL Y-17324]|uniref:Uncharacterized protein n=1 Tax=Suhomyces tanzawaensis NRRL Y-17324 TaxID=984487 RepID=A0A1E4SG40_9ASCO|nr:uncharacterized protein CANTADRAFT_266053 [Suhomyces tanzawaensis NRRL Y-17324]ODV78446.1 hypothetical protein CANTADRAFT_266053 [Suhomyces tanzawaensis NRRL Y-17324]
MKIETFTHVSSKGGLEYSGVQLSKFRMLFDFIIVFCRSVNVVSNPARCGTITIFKYLNGRRYIFI